MQAILQAIKELCLTSASYFAIRFRIKLERDLRGYAEHGRFLETTVKLGSSLLGVNHQKISSLKLPV